MNTVNKNILANYIGKLWSFVSVFIFVRFYIDLLGIESIAIINFYAVILGLLAFADIGLTATLTRELSRNDEIESKSTLLYTFERIYLGLCLVIVVVMLLSSDFIANNFLESKTYSHEIVAYYLRLMSIGVVLQLFSTLYEGGLQGLQKQVLTNKIKIIWSFSRSGLVILPILFFPKLEIFFCWQILCNFLLLYILRKNIYALLPSEKLFFSKQILSTKSKYALSMTGIALISAINIQMDKLVVSRYLSMKEFGYYSIANTISQLPIMIASPVIVAVFPLLSMYVSAHDIDLKIKTFHKYSFLITLLVAPIVFSLWFYTIPIVSLWTGKADIAITVNYIVKMQIISGFFLCMQLTPFYVALAHGYTKINLYTGIVGIIITIPLMIYCIKHYGMLGATIPSVFINGATFFVISMHVIIKKMRNQLTIWLLWDVFLPVIITLFVGLFVEIVFKSIFDKNFFIVKSLIIGVLSSITNILLFNRKFPQNILINFAEILKLLPLSFQKKS